MVVYRAVNQFGSDCHFGVESLACVWAGTKGTVERVTLTPVPEFSVVTTRPAQQPVEGIHSNPYPAKCPVTGLPYFMHLEHPELGVIPTFGGPFDSYSIPYPEGSPDDPWHQRQLVSHRYCHDKGYWVDDEFIPLRIIHEDVLSDLQDDAAPVAQTEQQPVAWARQCDMTDPEGVMFVSLYEYRKTGYSVPLYAAPVAQTDLAARVAELETQLSQQHEAHRKTWRQLEQAQAELAALKAGGPAHG